MTTTTNTDPRVVAVVPDEPIPLPTDHLACAACGVAVARPPDTAITWAEAMTREGHILATPPRIAPVALARCSTCSLIGARASDMLSQHPRVSARVGDVVALHRVESALFGLAALGKPIPSPGKPVELGELNALLQHLAVPGASVRWIARFAPVRLRGAKADTCSPYPWAHVRGSARSALRRGHLAVFNDRLAVTAPPIALRPPPVAAIDPLRPTIPAPGGCLMCGCRDVLVSALDVARLGGRENAQAQLWTSRRVRPEGVGGRTNSLNLDGYTCPPCTDAADVAGAMGPSAMEQALVDYLDVAGRWDGNSHEIDGLYGWGALVVRAHREGESLPEPNAEPWGHLAGLDDLRERLRPAAGVSD